MRSKLHALLLVAVCSLFFASAAKAVDLVGPDKIFVRFTNLRDDGGMMLVRLNVVPNHYKPFSWTGKTVYVGHDGEGDAQDADRYIDAGERSPWVDVGQYMNLQGTRSYDTYLSPLLCGVMTSPSADGLHVMVEVAAGKGVRVIRRLEIHKADLPATGAEREFPWMLGYSVWNGGRPILPTVGLLVPARPELQPRVYTFEEALKWQLDAMEELPDSGRVPSQYVFTSRGREVVLDTLGYRGYPEGVVEGNLGDEISISIDIPEDQQNQRFREAMKARGMDPVDLMSAADAEAAVNASADEKWAKVSLLPAMVDRPRQFYESANFRYELWYETLAARTRALEAKYPDKKVIAGANFSPHMNVWPDVRQWVGPFKANAMTMTWTEDWWWQLPEISPQGYGFLLDGLRLAGSYHGAPMQYYIMPFKGNSEDNIKRQHGLALMHGATIINHFHTQAQSLITWDYVDLIESPRTYQVLHDMIRDFGAVEHRLFPAAPKKAEVAIMLSRAADTWDTRDLGGAGHLYGAEHNVHNDERKAIWLALRHAQYPVDLITDEDVAEGRLAGYKAVYVVGEEMLRDAAKPLAKWVEAGGVLYGTSGGGARDEYRQRIPEMERLYGTATGDIERQTELVRPRKDLPGMKPMDTMTVRSAAGGSGLTEGVMIDALAYRATLTPAGDATTVVATWADGGPAMTERVVGRGKVIYAGAPIGLAYLAPAATESSQVLPTAYPAAIRDVIAMPAKLAGVTRPVVASNPLVEAQYMTGPNGDAVVLTNWSKEPVEIDLRFEGMPGLKRLQSLREAGYFKGHLHESKRGMLEVGAEDGRPAAKLTVDVIDVLYVN